MPNRNRRRKKKNLAARWNDTWIVGLNLPWWKAFIVMKRLRKDGRNENEPRRLRAKFIRTLAMHRNKGNTRGKKPSSAGLGAINCSSELHQHHHENETQFSSCPDSRAAKRWMNTVSVIKRICEQETVRCSFDQWNGSNPLTSKLFQNCA